MSKDEFVDVLIKNILSENIDLYKSVYNHMERSEITEPHWQESVKMFDSLTEQNKSIFFKIINQVQIDTISNVLGVLDGISYTPQDGEFILTHNSEKINEDIQSLFLSKFE